MTALVKFRSKGGKTYKTRHFAKPEVGEVVVLFGGFEFLSKDGAYVVTDVTTPNQHGLFATVEPLSAKGRAQ